MKQKIYNYIAIFDSAEEGGFNVSFPALPGCVTFGRNFEDAKKRAEEILKLWLEELASQGEEIPTTKHRPIVVDEIQVSLPAR